MKLTSEGIMREFVRKRGDSNVFQAVEPTDFQLKEGLVTVLAGHSGSGKSTLLHMLAGLLVPTAGVVKAGDVSLYELDDEERSAFRNRHIGIIPQGQTALRSLTTFENVMLPYRLSDAKSKEREAVSAARAESLLERMGIADLKDVMPSEMSGGEIRRMAIARALLLEPEILLADEPTADLDPENTAVVLSLLREAARGGTSVLIVTHDADAAACADRMFQMDRGRLTETAVR